MSKYVVEQRGRKLLGTNGVWYRKAHISTLELDCKADGLRNLGVTTKNIADLMGESRNQVWNRLNRKMYRINVNLSVERYNARNKCAIVDGSKNPVDWVESEVLKGVINA